MVVYLAYSIIKTIFSSIFDFITDPTTVRLLFISGGALILLDATGLYTLSQFYSDFIAGIVLFLEQLYNIILNQIDKLITWFNDVIINYIRNQIV